MSEDAVAGKGKILVHTDNNMSQLLADMKHMNGPEPGMMVQVEKHNLNQLSENKE